MIISDFSNWHIIQENIGRTKVFIDGIEIKGVKHIKYEHEANHIPSIKLEVMPGTVNLEGTLPIDIKAAPSVDEYEGNDA